MSDLFDSCVKWEETSIREGHSDGIRCDQRVQNVLRARYSFNTAVSRQVASCSCCRDGEIAGKLEGRDLGIQKGLELGTEVGYYSGCAQVTGYALQDVEHGPRPLLAAPWPAAEPPLLLLRSGDSGSRELPKPCQSAQTEL